MCALIRNVWASRWGWLSETVRSHGWRSRAYTDVFTACFGKPSPSRLPAPVQKSLTPEMGVSRSISTPARTNSVFEKEVRAGRGYGLGTGFLPGGDHYVGYPVALSGQAAFGVGFAVEAGAQVVEGEVDDSGHSEGVLGHHQIDRRRHFHKATNHAAVDGGQDGVAEVFFFLGQAEDQVVTEAFTLETDPLGIGHGVEHSGEITAFPGVFEDFRVGHSVPPVIRSR